MSGAAGPSKKSKTFIQNERRTFFFLHDGIFKVHFPHLTVDYRNMGNVQWHCRTENTTLESR